MSVNIPSWQITHKVHTPWCLLCMSLKRERYAKTKPVIRKVWKCCCMLMGRGECKKLKLLVRRVLECAIYLRDIIHVRNTWFQGKTKLMNLLLIIVSMFAGKKNPIVLFQYLIKMCKCQNWKKQLLFSTWLLQWEGWQCVKDCKQKQRQILL